MGFLSAIQWLIVTLLSMYILVVLLRFTLQLQRISFFNPLGQLSLALTNQPLQHVRKLIPMYKGIDWPSFVFAYALSLLMVGVQFYFSLNFISWLLVGLNQCLGIWLNVYFYAMMGLVLLSWISPGNPMVGTFDQMVRPILRPFQRIIPAVSGIDLSPIFGILALKFIELFILNKFTAFLLMSVN
jgi:YggT family protein